MLEELFAETERKMDKAVETLDRELKSLRTGRSSVSMVDHVMVDAYGTRTPLNQIASINTPDASTIMIQPWDINILAAVEKTLLAANLGLTPNNDGKVIRLNVPALTEETRRDMVKKAHEIGEGGHIAVRNIRRHTNDEIKKTERNHEITEDERKRFLDDIQKKTDGHIARIDELVRKKETEIMKV